jgi:hypothetical protein
MMIEHEQCQKCALPEEGFICTEHCNQEQLSEKVYMSQAKGEESIHTL